MRGLSRARRIAPFRVESSLKLLPANEHGPAIMQLVLILVELGASER